MCGGILLLNLLHFDTSQESPFRYKRQIEAAMVCGSGFLSCYLAILLLLFTSQSSHAHPRTESVMKTDVFLSPSFELEPGYVSNKFYYNIDFPKGHIAIKSFDAEVIDGKGNPVPLHETYLHHWIVVRYYQRTGVDLLKHDSLDLQSDHIIIRNNGMCDHGLPQYFGLGSETRRTVTDVPDPYGIEVGNQADVPAGYEEIWMLNVHAIDTRGAEDKLGCTECRCDLYNITMDGYDGGLRCCHDGAQCRVKERYQGLKRSLYLRYRVNYVEWDSSIVPVQIYILDVTDIWTKGDESRGLRARHLCLIEYDVQSCPVGMASDGCTHTKSLTVSLPSGGDVIYGVGHQHAGGSGTALYGEGGRVICSSKPTYGTSDEPGNEAGYIVGMSICYPSPGSVKISAGEKLTLVSNYSSVQKHTGVMGLFYILLADSSAKPKTVLHLSYEAHWSTIMSNSGWAIAVFGVGLVAVIIVWLLSSKSGRGEGYEAVMI